MSMIGDRTTQKAMRPHSCACCDGRIEIGERYDRWFWRDSSDVYSVKVHQFCDAYFRKHHPDRDEFAPDLFWDDIHEWRRDVEATLALPRHLLDENYRPGEPCYSSCCAALK